MHVHVLLVFIFTLYAFGGKQIQQKLNHFGVRESPSVSLLANFWHQPGKLFISNLCN